MATIYEILCYKGLGNPKTYLVKGFNNSERLARMFAKQGFIVVVDIYRPAVLRSDENGKSSISY